MIFLSHATEDLDLTDQIRTFLESRGLPCWLARRDIPPGSEYAAAILKPFVREQCAWVTRTHGEFQLVYYGHLLRVAEGRNARGWPVVTNVGYRPTFRDGRDLVAEAHLIDYSGDLYGQEVDLAFEGRLRGEIRFDSIDALRAQIARDVAAARVHLGL